jgi:hypothetical protein
MIARSPWRIGGVTAISFGRALRAGLSRLRRLAASRLAPTGVNPSRCEDCRFWGRERWLGMDEECRRRSPAGIDPALAHRKGAQWPHTGPNDWCGDFEPR